MTQPAITLTGPDLRRIAVRLARRRINRGAHFHVICNYRTHRAATPCRLRISVCFRAGAT